MTIIDIDELIGSTFEMPDESGKMQQNTIKDVIKPHEESIKNNPTHIKFRVSRNHDKYEDIMACDQVMDHIERQGEDPVYWELRQIVGHQGPLNQNHPNYKGSNYNVTVEWENGETTDEPLSIIAVDAPVACAVHAKKKNPLNLPGWK